MADKTIPELSAASALGATDEFPVSQGGGDATKYTGTQLATFIAAQRSLAVNYSIVSRSTNYTVTTADLGKIIQVTNNDVTISFDPAATLTAGFWCWVESLQTTATHETTLDPNGAETIDGVATLILRRGERALVWCDGTNLQVLGRARGYAENFAPSDARGFATGALSVSLGSNTVSSGQSSIVSGANSTASGNYSRFHGNSGNISGLHADGHGNDATASGDYSRAFGLQVVSGIYGKDATASGQFSAAGDAQRAMLVLRRSTTDATPIALTSNGGAASTTNQVILPDNSAYRVTGEVVAMQQAADGTATASYSFVALVRRGANAAATTLPYSSVTTEFETTAGWDLTLAADTTNGGLAVTATGAAATDIRWVCTAYSTEVTYA